STAEEVDVEKAAKTALRRLAEQRATWLLVYDNVPAPDARRLRKEGFEPYRRSAARRRLSQERRRDLRPRHHRGRGAVSSGRTADGLPRPVRARAHPDDAGGGRGTKWSAWKHSRRSPKFRS